MAIAYHLIIKWLLINQQNYKRLGMYASERSERVRKFSELQTIITSDTTKKGALFFKNIVLDKKK